MKNATPELCEILKACAYQISAAHQNFYLSGKSEKGIKLNLDTPQASAFVVYGKESLQPYFVHLKQEEANLIWTAPGLVISTRSYFPFKEVSFEDWLAAATESFKDWAQHIDSPYPKSTALLHSMALRYNHGYGLLSEIDKQVILTKMSLVYDALSVKGADVKKLANSLNILESDLLKLREEMLGEGFFKP